MSDFANEKEVTRRELILGMIQKEFTAYHPLLSIARIAHHEGADLKLQFDCHRTIAKYVEPELKSLEVKGEVTGRHRVQVSLFGDDTQPSTQLDGNGRVQGLEMAKESVRQLPGGAVIDVEPSVVDRTTAVKW